jgi:hypothetical protein
MMRRWTTKRSTATGMDMITAAASFSGFYVPGLSCPEASWATPTSAGRAIGSTTDQNTRNVPAPSSSS